MIKKNTLNKRKLILKISVIVCSLALLVISFLVDLGIIPIPDILVSNVKDTESLFFTLFTVQASVSTVSIAIISIITGLVSENILGISVSRFITHLKPKLFKHNSLIITCLVLTFLNYICTSFAFFNFFYYYVI